MRFLGSTTQSLRQTSPLITRRRVMVFENVVDATSLVRHYNAEANAAEKIVLMEWFYGYIRYFENPLELLLRSIFGFGQHRIARRD